MRNVIQIGLHQSLEFLYLTESDWRKYYLDPSQMHSVNEFERIPYDFLPDPEPFRYYGVDCCPESIVHLAPQIASNPNARLICCGISDSFYGIADWNQAENLGDWLHINHNIVYPCVTMPMLFELLSIDDLAILALDIEGYEYFVLDTIKDWPFLPKFISVEVHNVSYISEKDRAIYGCQIEEVQPALIEKLMSCGYELVGKGQEYGQSYLKFLRD